MRWRCSGVGLVLSVEAASEMALAASDAAPDPKKARRALAKVLPPLEVTHEGRPLQGWQFEYQFVDLSAIARPGDVLAFPGNVPHSYRNNDANRAAQGISAVLLARAGV